MQLSTKARYGLRALLDIAMHSDGRPVLLKDIADRQEVSKSYLEQLTLSLQAAGLIRGIRGKKGGFVLTRPPSEIRLIEVIRALEKTLTLVDCVDYPELCPRAERCAAHDLWCRLSEVLSRELEATSLQSLVEQQREKNGNGASADTAHTAG